MFKLWGGENMKQWILVTIVGVSGMLILYLILIWARKSLNELNKKKK